MVNVSIDVTDLGGEARPGDKVVFWRPRMGGSATHAGRVISTAPVTVFLTDGKATVSDVEPGEMTVLLQCRGVESQGPVTVGVPDGNGTVTLRSLIESQFTYAPPIVSAVQEAAANASASERAAIEAQVRSEAAADRADAKVDDAINNGANLVRNEVKQDADRAVSARQAATQSETNAAASEGAAASSASNAATSETNAKQSETNAGDYAAVATTAATEAVDAMDSVSDIIGANYATHEYVDSEVSDARFARTWLYAGSNIDALPREDIYGVVSAAVSQALALPEGWWGKLHEHWVNATGTIRLQRWEYWKNGTLNLWVRQLYGGNWSAWTRILPVTVSDADKWAKGAVTSGITSIDQLTDGMWAVASGTVATALGLPGTYGNLQIMTIANSRTAWWINTNGKFYIAIKSGGAWGDFQEIGATQEIEPPAASTNEWYKTVPMAVTTGSAISYRSPTSGLYRVLTQVTAPVSRFRLHVDMRHSHSETEVSGATLKGISVGHRDGTQGMKNLTNILTSDATVAANGEWVSEWVRHDLTQETFIEYWYEAPNEVIRMAAPAWEQQEDGSWVQKNTAPFFIWMELETYADTPVVAMLGDSTGVGSGSITAVWDSPLHITARKQKFIPVLYADTGHGLGTTSSMASRKIAKWAGFAEPDSVILEAGSNDIHGAGRTLEYVTTRLDIAINLAKQLAPVVYAATIKPRRNPDPAQESVRIDYNNYLRDEYEALGLHAVVDYSQAVAPTGVISDEYSADDAHLNSAGQNAMAEGLNFPVCRPAIALPWAA